jgi:putative polyhydroxyalkanoate system protein
MSDIEIKREHDRGIDEVREKADQLLRRQDRIKAVDWNEEGTEAAIDGEGFSGRLTITEDTVTGTIDLSTMAKPFESMIRERLERQIDDMMD